VSSTHGHGPAERGGDAKREEVPRRVIQSLHGQRAVRRQPGRFFLPGRLADVVGVCLCLLHIAPAERLHERVKLPSPPPFILCKKNENGEKDKTHTLDVLPRPAGREARQRRVHDAWAQRRAVLGAEPA
jgi:hypothetical protein